MPASTGRHSQRHVGSQSGKLKRIANLALLNGLPQCCFQTYSYGRHFISSCVRVCGYEALEGGIGVDAEGSITTIAYCPIGIDSDRIEAERQAEAVKPKIEALRQLYKGKKIIVGRDKLDSTKGVLPKVSRHSSSCLGGKAKKGHAVRGV